MNVNLTSGKSSRKPTLANMGLENFSLFQKSWAKKAKNMHTKKVRVFLICLSPAFLLHMKCYQLFTGLDYMACESVPSSAVRTDQLCPSRVGSDGRDTTPWGVVVFSLESEQTCFATKPQSSISDLLRLWKQLTNQPSYCEGQFPMRHYQRAELCFYFTRCLSQAQTLRA